MGGSGSVGRMAEQEAYRPLIKERAELTPTARRLALGKLI